MLTERCFIKENFGCENCSRTALSDRKGAKFPIIREYEHRNLILNSAITYMGDKSGELDSVGILHRHAIFSVETEREALVAIEALKNGRAIDPSVTVRRMGKRDPEKQKEQKSSAQNANKRKHNFTKRR